ncbi:hypothetical protein [Mycolicibacterium parafortuitum]|uniref:hypothetical protein n=1 Tax=Mycolicibacterium parafortuitum TaxID=39692 RepID=UPI002970006E
MGGSLRVGGFADVHPGTPVTVKTGKGEILTTTYLEDGQGGCFQAASASASR